MELFPFASPVAPSRLRCPSSNSGFIREGSAFILTGMKPQIFASGNPSIPRRDFVRLAASAGALAVANLIPASAEPAAKFKAAVIGHTGRGDYGHGLESIFGNRPNIELVAVADPDPAGRARTAAKVGAPRHYADYREMLEKERPGLVSLAMRHADQHHAIALAALKAGAHVYCEKPFVTAPVEADELLAEAERRRLKIAVAHTMHMMPVIVRLKQAVAEFAFPKGVNATFTSDAKLRETVGHWGIEFFGSKRAARINCDIAPNVFVRRSTSWKPEGKTDAWEPLDMSQVKSPPPHNLGPVGDWLDAIAKDREPECSGRNG